MKNRNTQQQRTQYQPQPIQARVMRKPVMRAVIASSLCLWLVAGCVGAADGEDLPEPASVEPASASVVAVEVLVPDESGRAHRAVAVVSSNIAGKLEWFLADVRAVARPAGLPRSSLSYQERRDQASRLAAEAMSADPGDRVLLAIVFEEDTIGWHGTMKPDRVPEAVQLPDGSVAGGYFNDGLFVTASTTQAHTASYWCNGAYAYGSLSAGSTGGAAMRFYTNAPWPLGYQIFNTLNVSPGSTWYIWGLNNVSAWYYVEATFAGGSGIAQITNTMACY